MLFLSCVCYDFVRVRISVPCGHLYWKELTSLLLSYWYLESGVVIYVSILDIYPLSCFYSGHA